jgi:hypothetical protein
VSSINDIDLTAADADQYIYMVPTETAGSNKYNEYMVIDGKVEPVGSWEVDLDDYATKEYVTSQLGNVDLSEINEQLEEANTKSSLLESKLDAIIGKDLLKEMIDFI